MHKRVRLQPPPGKEHRTYAGFWTRMCDDCEIKEQIRINARLDPTNAHFAPGALPPNAADMQQYPKNTCTCLPKLEREDLCIRHRAQRVANHFNPNDFNSLLSKRNRNALWLADLALDPANGISSTAAPTRMAWRKHHKKYRACRCGREVETSREACFMQCMACEGVWQYRRLRYNPALLGPRHYSENSERSYHLFQLNRFKSVNLIP